MCHVKQSLHFPYIRVFWKTYSVFQNKKYANGVDKFNFSHGKIKNKEGSEQHEKYFFEKMRSNVFETRKKYKNIIFHIFLSCWNPSNSRPTST